MSQSTALSGSAAIHADAPTGQSDGGKVISSPRDFLLRIQLGCQSAGDKLSDQINQLRVQVKELDELIVPADEAITQIEKDGGVIPSEILEEFQGYVKEHQQLSAQLQQLEIQVKGHHIAAKGASTKLKSVAARDLQAAAEKAEAEQRQKDQQAEVERLRLARLLDIRVRNLKIHNVGIQCLPLWTFQAIGEDEDCMTLAAIRFHLLNVVKDMSIELELTGEQDTGRRQALAVHRGRILDLINGGVNIAMTKFFQVSPPEMFASGSTKQRVYDLMRDDAAFSWVWDNYPAPATTVATTKKEKTPLSPEDERRIGEFAEAKKNLTNHVRRALALVIGTSSNDPKVERMTHKVMRVYTMDAKGEPSHSRERLFHEAAQGQLTSLVGLKTSDEAYPQRLGSAIIYVVASRCEDKYLADDADRTDLVRADSPELQAEVLAMLAGVIQRAQDKTQQAKTNGAAQKAQIPNEGGRGNHFKKGKKQK